MGSAEIINVFDAIAEFAGYAVDLFTALDFFAGSLEKLPAFLPA